MNTSPVQDSAAFDLLASHYKPLPSQYWFHNGRWSDDSPPSKYKAYFGSVGSGKTMALCYEGIRLGYVNPKTLGVIAAPTFRMLEDVAWRKMHEVLEEENVPFKSAGGPKWRIRLLEPGTDIIFRSCDDPERLRGTTISFFGVDEAAMVPEAAWARLEARLREPRAKELIGFLATTPMGRNWCYRRFVNPRTRMKKYFAVLGQPAENQVNLPEDFYVDLAASYSERFYAQEVGVQFLDLYGGSVYHSYSERNVKRVGYDPNEPLIWSLDFNVNPLCSVIAQRIPLVRGDKHNFTMNVLDEIVIPGAKTYEACEEFVDRTRKLTSRVYGNVAVRVYGDPGGNAQQTSATDTDWQIVRRFLGRYPEFQPTFHVPRAAPLVKDRTNAVNGVLRDAMGVSRLFFDPRCKELQRDMEEVKWKTDPSGNTLVKLDKSDPDRTHTSDALGYYVWVETELRKPGGQMPGMLPI